MCSETPSASPMTRQQTRQLIGSLLALVGIVMPLLGRHWVLFVWVRALVWFLLSDRVRRFVYRTLEPIEGKKQCDAALPIAKAGQ